jgi:hypothetical protein
MKPIGHATGQNPRSQTKITKRTQFGPVFSTKPKNESQFPADLLLVGNQGGTNVGWSLYQACPNLGLAAHFADALQAAAAPAWKRRISWRLLGHRPARLSNFSSQVLGLCQNLRPATLLATGLAPITRPTLQAIGNLGIARLNYLTDDPWNPAFRARWFLEALPMYDTVFSPRRANIPDLENLGCRTVRYLPFGFDPNLCYPQPADPAESIRLSAEVLFVGGADRDRVPFIAALASAGFSIALYGDNWDRYPETRPHYRGYADPQTLRQATAAAKIALCLVRRANRDGHVMRTFEIPAIGACMLVEDTQEHRELFSTEGESVLYFRSIPEMIEKARRLLASPVERQRLATAVHSHIMSGRHTYQDRLAAMWGRLEACGGLPARQLAI